MPQAYHRCIQNPPDPDEMPMDPPYHPPEEPLLPPEEPPFTIPGGPVIEPLPIQSPVIA